MNGLFVEAKWEPTSDYVPVEYEVKTQKTRSSGIVWRYPKLRLRSDLPEPVPGSHEVKVEVKACGICGSDLLVVRQNENGYTCYPGYTRMNLIPGHEASGRVVEVGKKVKYLKVGDDVALAEGVWCGECYACRSGYPNQCTDLDGMGVTRDGSFATYVCAPERVCWKLDELRQRFGSTADDRVYEYGTLVQPTAVCYNAIFEVGKGFRPGAYAAVFGAGPIGLLSTALLKASGAAKVIVFELSEYRAELARKMGADIVLDSNKLEEQGIAVSDALMDLTRGYGVDMTIESAGIAPHIMPEVLKSMAVDGKLVEAAVSGKPSPVLLTRLQFRKGQIYGSLGDIGHGFFEKSIRLIASGQYDPAHIITDRYALDDGLAAFERARRIDAGKVLIKP